MYGKTLQSTGCSPDFVAKILAFCAHYESPRWNMGTFVIQQFLRVLPPCPSRRAYAPFISPTMTQDQIKDLKGRAEALRRYL